MTSLYLLSGTQLSLLSEKLRADEHMTKFLKDIRDQQFICNTEDTLTANAKRIRCQVYWIRNKDFNVEGGFNGKNR